VNLERAVELARAGRLYPSLILHGGDADGRRAAALGLARTLLCLEPEAERPCGVCRGCSRIDWPGAGGREGDRFHPDFAVLERDLKTATSVDATKELLRGAQVSPFEARGQVFVVASAESLSGEAANALLKSLEEPHLSAPRHFLLLAPSQFDLLATLRSRSLALYLGGAERAGGEAVAPAAEAFGQSVERFLDSGNGAHLFAAAASLERVGDFKEVRDRRPWETAAEVVLASSRRPDAGPEIARRLLALAEDLLDGPRMRVRGIAAARILEGLVHARLADLA